MPSPSIAVPYHAHNHQWPGKIPTESFGLYSAILLSHNWMHRISLLQAQSNKKHSNFKNFVEEWVMMCKAIIYVTCLLH
jgi:hypothetical protein